jgi:hypothetical protein
LLGLLLHFRVKEKFKIKRLVNIYAPIGSHYHHVDHEDSDDELSI